MLRKAFLVCICLVSFGLGEFEIALADGDRLPPPQSGQSFPQAGGNAGNGVGASGNTPGLMQGGKKRRRRRGQRRKRMMGQGGQGGQMGQGGQPGPGTPNWSVGQGAGQDPGNGAPRKRRRRKNWDGQGNPSNPPPNSNSNH